MARNVEDIYSVSAAFRQLYVSSFAGVALGSVMAQNSAANVTGGNMTAGGNITNITTGGGGNMTAGENKLTCQVELI